MTFMNLPFPRFSKLFHSTSTSNHSIQVKSESNHSKPSQRPESLSKLLSDNTKRSKMSYQKRKNKQRLQEFIAYIEANLSDDMEMEQICRTLGVSYTVLYRLVKATTQLTPSMFIRSYRLKKALHLLETTDWSMADIAYEVGFSDPNYFSRVFRAAFGMPPSAWRR